MKPNGTSPIWEDLCLDPPGGGAETWKPVPGFPGYLFSDLGRALSADRPDSRGRWRTGRILRQTIDGHGYLRVDLYRNGKGHFLRVHRLVLLAFVGPGAPGEEACHNNGDRTDNRLDNLRWGTRSDNNLDQVRHGTHNEARKTHCPRGHLLDLPNLVAAKARRGWRECLACKRATAYVSTHPGADLQAVADRYYLKITGGQDPLTYL